MSALARVAVRSALSSSTRVSAPLAIRSLHMSSAALADDSSRDFKKKESAQEAEYASREERRTLADMLSRMERDADPDGSKAKAQLEPILQKHGVKSNSKILDDLISWKRKPAH